MGVDYLKSSIDTGVTNISSTLKEDDSGYSIYLGWPINEGFDFEMSYQDFGEASLSGNTGINLLLTIQLMNLIKLHLLNFPQNHLGMH